jgi:pimeloyl-ACP methyl ester carboxylesterase
VTDVELRATDGTRLAARATGAGTPLVFVHGSMGGLDSWTEVARHLPGHRIWSYARRGHEPSGNPDASRTFAIEAADLRVVAAAAADSGRVPDVVAGSYGASVALHAAVADPSAFASLTLFEPPLLQVGPHLAPTLADFARTRADRPGMALEAFLRHAARIPEDLLCASSPRDLPHAEAARLAAAAGGDLAAMADESDDVSRWAAIELPVLLLGGAESWPPLPDALDALAAVLPHARRVVLDGHSHTACATAPELVAAAVRDFLDRSPT